MRRHYTQTPTTGSRHGAAHPGGLASGLRQARFSIGQCIQHRLFDYRGVIVDVDAVFRGTDAWYEQVARTRPPKDEPWYRVLVHDASHETYVAERNLEAERAPAPIRHPLLDRFFAGFSHGAYDSARRSN